MLTLGAITGRVPEGATRQTVSASGARRGACSVDAVALGSDAATEGVSGEHIVGATEDIGCDADGVRVDQQYTRSFATSRGRSEGHVVRADLHVVDSSEFEPVSAG